MNQSQKKSQKEPAFIRWILIVAGVFFVALAGLAQVVAPVGFPKEVVWLTMAMGAVCLVVGVVLQLTA